MTIDGSPLVDGGWLEARLGAPDVKPIDASWRMPGSAGSTRADFDLRRIPGAAFFDLDEVSDRQNDLPHMLPSSDQFAQAVGKLGIAAGDQVVVYDEAGVFSSARVWWTFRAFGHERVAVLDGGLKKWLAEGRPVETSVAPPPQAKTYVINARRNIVRTADDVRQALAKGSAHVLDARPSARFEGKAPEPRPGLRAGHMPGARSLPFGDLLREDGRLRSTDELRALFADRGIDAGDAVIATCGSGVTAAVIALALERVGAREISIYDGSWAEWGRVANEPALFPVVQGT